MHLTYQAKLNLHELMQGDVIRRSAEIDQLLKEVHPHFYSHPKNLYFMVLTQSCDLVPRNPGGGCKAPYISIAPVRDLEIVISRFLDQQDGANVKSSLPVKSDKVRNKTNEFVRRLMSNNEPGYFYLDSLETKLTCDCVAFLNLSIAIKSDLHYHKCLDAKILELTETFQAKLGWLVGQMYSRVGTPDWDQKTLSAKSNKVVEDSAIWVEESKIRALEEKYDLISKDDAEVILSKQEIGTIIRATPSKKQEVLREAKRIITDLLGAESEVLAEKIRKRLENDARMSTLLK